MTTKLPSDLEIWYDLKLRNPMMMLNKIHGGKVVTNQKYGLFVRGLAKQARSSIARAMIELGRLDIEYPYSQLGVHTLQLMLDMASGNDILITLEDHMDFIKFSRLYYKPNRGQGKLQEILKGNDEITETDNEPGVKHAPSLKRDKESEVRYRKIARDTFNIEDSTLDVESIYSWHVVTHTNPYVFVSSKDVKSSGAALLKVIQSIGKKYREIYLEVAAFVSRIQKSLEIMQMVCTSEPLSPTVFEYILNIGCQGFARFSLQYTNDENHIYLTTGDPTLEQATKEVQRRFQSRIGLEGPQAESPHPNEEYAQN